MKRITISIADSVFEDIENKKPKKMSRSEYVEDLLRFALSWTGEKGDKDA